ncbi:energy transducer TonB [Erythrobacter sp. 3-20A1M]|uniref:TonB C-terminal domain-containing protein n=1 Tax=Erythrobacter sp. 3-20A1M TaxID=2653850 RepID=UPI001BFC7758|nr:TonB C-terminal domain-containing protein [Erythrobacter sp. 3-20A1M]QWC56531.1 energy transducer TonB [Erythrobacter sp. 3-20A1M]
MAATALRRDEKVGLGIALALHLALVAVLLLQDDERQPIEQPQRVTVNLASDVGLTSAAPQPVPESRTAEAPVLSDLPPPPALEAPLPEPLPQPSAQPQPQPQPKPQPKPRSQPTSKPQPKRTSTPTKRTETRQASKPAPKTATTTKKTGGASRIGKDFLDGAGESRTSQDTRVPASQIGASAQASLAQAIARQLKPHWRPVDGADREKLVSVISWRMNPDGSLAGKPRLVRQSGITDANKAQAARHAENAIRAVELAAPFNLPDEYYNGWKYVSAFSFDWKLSQ